MTDNETLPNKNKQHPSIEMNSQFIVDQKLHEPSEILTKKEDPIEAIESRERDNAPSMDNLQDTTVEGPSEFGTETRETLYNISILTFIQT